MRMNSLNTCELSLFLHSILTYKRQKSKWVHRVNNNNNNRNLPQRETDDELTQRKLQQQQQHQTKKKERRKNLATESGKVV